MALPDGGGPPVEGAPLGEGCPKRPWHSKKWTYAMWVTTLLCILFIFYIERAPDTKDLVLYAFLALIGALTVLTIGGVYALDRYRMGLVQVVEAARGKNVDEAADPVPAPSDADRSPLDDENEGPIEVVGTPDETTESK